MVRVVGEVAEGALDPAAPTLRLAVELVLLAALAGDVVGHGRTPCSRFLCASCRSGAFQAPGLPREGNAHAGPYDGVPTLTRSSPPPTLHVPPTRPHDGRVRYTSADDPARPRATLPRRVGPPGAPLLRGDAPPPHGAPLLR